MLFRVEFTIEGTPRGWQRAGTADGRHYVKKETVAEQAHVREKARKAFAGNPPITGPVRLELLAVFEMPMSWPSRVREMRVLPHVSKPDLDNIQKLILDALPGIAWLDDAQVCEVRARKQYGEAERVEIRIEEIPTTVDHPAVRRANKRALEETVTRRTARKKPVPRRASVRRAETPIGKRLR